LSFSGENHMAVPDSGWLGKNQLQAARRFPGEQKRYNLLRGAK
jgi:hypothetical protein